MNSLQLIYNPSPNSNVITMTVQDKLRESVSAFDFMNPGQVSDVKSRSATISVSAAIQSAVDYVFSIGGGTVYLPSGTYVLTECIVMKTNVNIIGDGKYSTVLRTQNYGSGATFNVGGVSSSLFYGNDVNNICIEGLTLRGVSINGSASSGITLTRTNNDNVSNIIIRNVLVDDQAGTGISINCPITSGFYDVKVRYVSGNGFSFYNGGTSCGFYNCYVVTGTQSGFNMNTMVYCTFVSCAAEVFGIGYNFISCSAMALIGCGAESNINRSVSYPGISYKTDNSTVALYSCYSTKSAASTASYDAGGTYASIEAGHFSGNFSLHNCRMMTYDGAGSVVNNRFIGMKLQNVPTSTTAPVGTGTITTGTIWSDSGVLKIV